MSDVEPVAGMTAPRVKALTDRLHIVQAAERVDGAVEGRPAEHLARMDSEIDQLTREITELYEGR